MSWSHMLVKQSDILGTVSQDILRGRPEHVLHDLKSPPSFIISVLLGSCPELTIVLSVASVTPRAAIPSKFSHNTPLGLGCCYH